MVKKREVADNNTAPQNPKALKIFTKLLSTKTFRFFKRNLIKDIHKPEVDNKNIAI